MRNRAEIEDAHSNVYKASIDFHAWELYALLLEVTLDVRDLLSARAREMPPAVCTGSEKMPEKIVALGGVCGICHERVAWSPVGDRTTLATHPWRAK